MTLFLFRRFPELNFGACCFLRGNLEFVSSTLLPLPPTLRPRLGSHSSRSRLFATFHGQARGSRIAGFYSKKKQEKLTWPSSIWVCGEGPANPKMRARAGDWDSKLQEQAHQEGK